MYHLFCRICAQRCTTVFVCQFFSPSDLNNIKQSISDLDVFCSSAHLAIMQRLLRVFWTERLIFCSGDCVWGPLTGSVLAVPWTECESCPQSCPVATLMTGFPLPSGTKLPQYPRGNVLKDGPAAKTGVSAVYLLIYISQNQISIVLVFLKYCILLPWSLFFPHNIQASG